MHVPSLRGAAVLALAALLLALLLVWASRAGAFTPVTADGYQTVVLTGPSPAVTPLAGQAWAICVPDACTVTIQGPGAAAVVEGTPVRRGGVWLARLEVGDGAQP